MLSLCIGADMWFKTNMQDEQKIHAHIAFKYSLSLNLPNSEIETV